MKIVIDIPEENYQVMLAKVMLDCRGCKITEFPEGHGSLIDAVLEIIDSWKEFNMGAHKSILNMISDDISALKGGEQG